MKQIQDWPEVKVSDDIEKAIRILRLRMNASGIFKDMKDRKNEPTSAGRKKLKRLRSERRKIKKEWQRASKKQ